MVWTSEAAAVAAIQSSSEGGLQDNVVEKQIEEANKLIERVMSALREIKLGITQYKTGPNLLPADSSNMPCRPGYPLKEITTPCMKKYRQPKSPNTPTKRCRSPPKYQARPPKCTPFSYDRPIQMTEVSNQACSMCNACGRPHTPKTSCNRYTCAQLGGVSVSMPKNQLKGEKPLVDEETDPTLRPFPVGDDRPKTRRGCCRTTPCTIQVQTQSYDPVEQEPSVVTEEPSHSMEALKAKLSTISEPSDTSSDHSSRKTDVKEDAKDALNKPAMPLEGPKGSKGTNTADKLVQRCVKCLKSGKPTRDCICAKILGVLSVSHQAPVSNVKPTCCQDRKKDRLRVQNIPPVSIKSGLVVQKVLDLAIKPTGSTDAVVDKTDNIKYEEVVEETGDPESLGKKLSFLSDEDKNEDWKGTSAHSYNLPSPASSSSTKLSVLQSYQVLPNQNMLQLDSDTPDLSNISGNVNIDVYKTYIDPYAEIMSTTDDDDQKEQQEVKLTRIRRTSMRPKTSSGGIKARLSEEDSLRSKQKRPTEPEDTSVQQMEKEISVQKLTEQEREQPLESLGMTVEAEKDRPVTAPAAFGLKSPFEIGLYENQLIQCGSSYIPTLKNEMKMKGTLSSGSTSGSRSPVTRYRSASAQADGSLEEDSSSVTISNDSEDSTAETANKALQVSFSSSSESSSSGTEVVSEQVSVNKKPNMRYNVSYVEDVKRNETVDNFLTGLTEQSAKSIDMFQKSHGNLEDKASNIAGSVPSGFEDMGSISTLDLDENAAMLKNLVHDPNRRKKSSSRPVTPTLSSNIPSVGSKTGKYPSVHCCQVEYNDVDLWNPVRLSDYSITRDTKENVETSTHRQTCSGSEKSIQRMSRHESSFRKSPLEHSASDPETLSNGEYKCKCSISSGEIHMCPFGRDMRNKVKYLKKHPERFLRKELGDSKLKILAQRRFYNHWVSYYIQLDSSRNNTSISTNSDENHMT